MVILVSSVVAHRRTTAPIFQNTPVDGSGLAPGVPRPFLAASPRATNPSR